MNWATIQKRVNQISIPKFSFGPKRALVGADAGNFSVKLIKAERAGSSWKIPFVGLHVRNGDPGASNVRKLVVDSGQAKSPGSLSIGDEKVEVHDFVLPNLPTDELNTAIDWEIKKTVASPEFVYHDVLRFQEPEQVAVQCVMAGRDLVKGRYDEAIQFGLQPKFLETESSALTAAAQVLFPKLVDERNVIFDLGYSGFRLVFVSRGRVAFSRSLYFGLGTLEDQIAQQTGDTPQDAGKMLARVLPNGGTDRTDPKMVLVERLFQESLYTLCEEYQRSEFFVKEQKGLEGATQVLLAGGGACYSVVSEYLKEHLPEKQVELMNPFKGISGLPTGIDESMGPLFACAFGLSLRGAQ